jgi:sugar/nucleoside kinase (ribokinase family)
MLVGCIGSDYHQRFTADLARYGIKSRVQQCRETGGFSLVYKNDRGDRDLRVLGIADPIREFPGGLSDIDAVLFGPILQETPAALIQAVREVTQAPFFLDPQGMLRRVNEQGDIEHFCNPELRTVAPYFEVIKANEKEAKVMTGISAREDAHGAAQALYEWGCKIAIVTIAEAGSVIYDGQTTVDIPAYATNAVDPTGAGDTYMAGFIHRYLEGERDLYTIGCFASAVASVMVENVGPDFPLSLQEAENRSQRLLTVGG